MKRLLFAVLCAASIQVAFSQNAITLEMFATNLNVTDVAKGAQIQDLFYLYLTEFDGMTVIDKRDQHFSEEGNRGQNHIFFCDILQLGSMWTCTFHLLKPHSDIQLMSAKNYSNYNKFLLDIRSSIQSLVDSLGENDVSVAANKISSLEDLSGSWSGESEIECIMILRGGDKGFVFFKGGASMGVSISMEGETLIVRQNVRANANFYPDLPRNVALVAALTAEPIVWTFTDLGNGQLAGKKNTLSTVYQDGVAVSAKPAIVDVVWTRLEQ